MKSIQCQHCAEYFTGETPHDVQMAMLPHYKTAHPDVMASNDDVSKKDWMEEFDRRWQAAEEV